MARTEPNFIMMKDEDHSAPIDHLRRRALRLLQAAEEAPNDTGRGRGGFAAPAALNRVEPAPARALAVGVITMPAVFIVVVMGALALFGKPVSEPRAQRSLTEAELLQQPASRPATTASLAASRSSPDQASIALGEDRRIVGISLDGDRVALHVESPAGSEILIYDYVAERIVASAPIVTSSLDAGDHLAMLTGAPVAALSPIMPADAGLAPSAPSIKPRSAD